MRCQEALNLISAYLDGALSQDQSRTLEQHMAKCGDCAREMEIQTRLASALREIGSVEIQAPPHLCGLVMGKLQAEKKPAFRWVPAAWRRVVATAAAVLLIAGGSAGITTGLKIAGTDREPGHGIVATVQTDGGMVTEPGVTEQSNPDHAVLGPENQTATGGTGPDPNGKAVLETAPTRDNHPSSNAAGVTAPVEPVELLSGGIKVNSTVLRLAVDDMATARARAVAHAAGAGAATQVFPEQSGGKKIVFIRLTVATNQAANLLANLSGLGHFVDRQDESRDNTSYYNELAVRHSELQTRINKATDPGERRQLEAQAASCKQEMDNMRAEADKRVIMLWLESR